jgi:hypothetical protein
MAMLRKKCLWVGLLMAGLVAAPAMAQDGDPLPPPEAAWDDERPTGGAPLDEEQSQAEMDDPFGEKKDGKWYLGLFYRHTFTPGFMLGIFLDQYEAANNPGTGFEFTYSKSNLDITGTLFWQGYRTYGAYRASGDPDNDTEIIDSNLSMAAVGVNFLWTTEFNDVVALQYGIDLAVGIVMGSMRRTEAYPTDNRNADGFIGGWAPCAGVGMPSDHFCQTETNGGHYNSKAQRWTSGGTLPNVWFRAALPHLALRFTPTEALRLRIDGGFDLFSGFFVGAAAAVGL